jgi:addiction module RelE/StbE family toxin
MRYTPIFLEHFETELEELLDFLKNKYSRSYVMRFIDHLSNSIDSLLDFPNMGSVFEGVYLFSGYRKLNIGNYFLLYKVKEESKKIFFVRILPTQIKEKIEV